MAKIKGSALLGFVQMIRADKSGRFDKYLTEQDREIISGRVLPITWYPLETFENCFKALAEEVAKGDMKMVWDWGRDYVDLTYGKVYKRVFTETDPGKAIKNHAWMYKAMYDTVEMELEEVSENEFIATFKGFDPSFEPWYQEEMGRVERTLEHAGAKEIKIEFLAKSWEGAPETKAKISWAR